MGTRWKNLNEDNKNPNGNTRGLIRTYTRLASFHLLAALSYLILLPKKFAQFKKKERKNKSRFKR
jgi:hypothetical protein